MSKEDRPRKKKKHRTGCEVRQRAARTTKREAGELSKHQRKAQEKLKARIVGYEAIHFQTGKTRPGSLKLF